MPDIRGVDVASFQGQPHGGWSDEPAAQGIEWAGVKITEVSPDGSVYVNPDAKADWDWLWEHKLGRIAYLYAHPAASVAATVAAFKDQMVQLGLEPGDGVAFDLETTDGRSPAEVASFARELAAELAQVTGRRPVCYTYVSFAQDGNCEGLENCFLWIASYTTPGVPVVPAPWKDWFAQQAGVNGTMDFDVAHFSSLAAMQDAMGAPQYQTVTGIHVTTGEESLINLSHLLQTEISTILRLTLNGSANHLFTTPLADYLDYGNFQALMPRGVTLRYSERVKV